MEKIPTMIVWSFFNKQTSIDLSCAVTKEKPSIYECHGATPIALEVTEDELYYMGIEDDIKLYGICEV